MSEQSDAEVWLDAHRRQKFDAFRRRFTDGEWAVFRAGECGYSEDGNTAVSMCRESRRHDRIYCYRHDMETMINYPDSKITVPLSVRDMGVDLPL